MPGASRRCRLSPTILRSSGRCSRCWDAERTFEQLREQNRGGERYSFIDGPITANNPMGVHHAWGRTLKDVFQRYKALRGYDQRYQNGFDCQGLWVEVEVEKSLGLNSKREIEEYGLAEFAARCRERVAEYAEVITNSRRLGRWMDWDNDYYTFSDTNIEYIWRFLKAVHERGWLYQGHRSTQWCPRCGTSLSQHEQAGEGNYEELDHPSLYVRFPLKRPRGRGARRLDDDAVDAARERRRRGQAGRGVRADATGGWCAGRAPIGRVRRSVVTRRGARRARVRGPVRRPRRRRRASSTGSSRGTRSRSTRAQGSSTSRPARRRGLRALAASTTCRCSCRSTSRADLPGYGALEGLHDRRGRGAVIVEDCASAGCSSRRAGSRTATRSAGAARRRSSSASSTTGSSRRDEVRQPLLDANATVEWTPAFYSKRMDDWLRNMGDWNISRKRYFGLPLPFYPCACGHLTVVGSRDELEQRALRGLDAAAGAPPALDRRGGDRLRGVRRARSTRVPEVGDAWLDAGIVPLSTLGWDNEAGFIPRRVCHGCRGGADRRPTSRTTRTGSSGSRPSGSLRCASRSGSGSTRCRSCR